MPKTYEVNFDGLVGPTYNYGGLSYGNLPSMAHEKQISYPKKAALQGLAKMKRVMDLGLIQGILPPQERPSLSYLRTLGFTGSDEEIFKKIAKEDPQLLRECSSASSMWAANSATVTPSCDTPDGRVHISIANLQNRLHRSLESEATYALFKQIFRDEKHFVIHPPLLRGGGLGDEGAANHIRFCREYGEKGVHLFVYGKSAFETTPSRFPPRQSLEASQAIARRHGLSRAQVIFARQNPEVIDRGVFHNDVISLGNLNLFLYQEEAFVNTDKVIDEISQKLETLSKCALAAIPVPISPEQALNTYFFNSQLLTDQQILLAPNESRGIAENLPFKTIYYSDVHESMKNGGGPACLRLRVELTEGELDALNPLYLLTEPLYAELVEWVERHYREQLTPEDLSDPSLLKESQEALVELESLLSVNKRLRV